MLTTQGVCGVWGVGCRVLGAGCNANRKHNIASAEDACWLQFMETMIDHKLIEYSSPHASAGRERKRERGDDNEHAYW